MSAAITSMRMQPTDGFVALAIPFFAVSWLPEQAGLCDPAANEVTQPGLLLTLLLTLTLALTLTLTLNSPR
tara:strand:+ start:94 stop:306 length:213 start_codon:yes stop_codon:yes gene_type:complete